jgi:hypothetical protein
MILRYLTRIGVAGVLAAGALGAVATPALAADVDFGLDLAGSTIAADAIGKWPRAHITNYGTTKPASFVVLFDTTKLDPSKVAADPTEFCSTEDGVVSCTVDRYVPVPGGTTRVAIPLLKVDGATGAAGKLTVTIKAEGDTVEANDSRTVDVTIGGHGADISVYASDVTWQNENGTFTDDPVPPGKAAPMVALIVNQGDMIASGVRVKVRLPEQTTFTERQYTGCVLSGDRRTADCELKQFPLSPQRELEDPVGSGMFFSFEVRVSPDAKGPVTLKGGTVTASAIEQYGVSAAQRSPAAELPDYVSWATAAELAEIDADPTDNTDKFVVFAGAPEGGNDGDGDSGDGDGGNGGGDDGSGGQGGGLPVTGPTSFVLGVAGLTAVVLGLVLFLVSRRRRVVVVTPGDE